ncbi:hypothetical protein FRC06_005108, partial [Ceratobasidium sp. 370]
MPICPCCGDETLSDQQIHRHLARHRRQLAAAFDIINQAEVGLAPHDDDLVPHGDDDLPAPDDDLAPRDDPAPCNGPVPGNVEPAPDNVGARRHGIDLAALIAREDRVSDGDADALADLDHVDNMDLDDANELFVQLPDVPLGLGVLRNPLVVANNWDSEDELADITPPWSEIDEGSVGSNERDPEFNEGDWMRGLDPDAEPEMDEEDVVVTEELQDYLRQHLDDLPEEEWLDIYDRFLTNNNCKTLKLLAARQHTHFSWAIYEDRRRDTCEELGLLSDFIAWIRLKALSNLES